MSSDSSFTPTIRSSNLCAHFIAALAIALLLIAFFAVRPHGTPGPAMRDFEAFYAAGVTANRGADPYSRAIWNAERDVPGVDTSHDETLPFVGPPAAIVLWRALALLPFDVAGRVWGAVLAVAMLTVVFGGLALVRAPRAVNPLLGAAIFAGAFGPLTSDVALGQPALVCAAAIVATLLLLRTRAWLTGASTAALAALQPNLCVILLARATDLRSIATLALGAVLFAGLALQNAGIAGIVRYLQLLAVHGSAETQTAIQITPAGVAAGFGADGVIAGVVRAVTALLALGLAAFAIARVRDAIARAGIASCALPFIVPFFHEHDFVVVLLPALLCALSARGRILAVAAIAAAACSIDWLGLGQRPNADVQSFVLACAGALGFVLIADLRRESLWSFAVPVLVAGVAVVASRHPVPIWPDALPPHWQPPAAATISQVWALEQRAAGLDAASAVWSTLRLLSLLSCALLGFTVYFIAKVAQGAPTQADAWPQLVDPARDKRAFGSEPAGGRTPTGAVNSIREA